MNAARDNIKDGYDLRDIFNEINYERGVIVDAGNAARDVILGAVNAKGTVKSVQRGRFYEAVVAGSYHDIDISSVDMNKASLNILRLTYNYTSSAQHHKNYAYLHSGSKIRVMNEYSSNVYMSVVWEVIEYA